MDLCGGVALTTSDFPRSVATLQKQANSLDLMMRELTVPRQYFHSKTGIPILPNEIDCDSDDDVDESWITNQSDRVRFFCGFARRVSLVRCWSSEERVLPRVLQLIDDFEDVTLEEKEFMKLWNRHIYTYRCCMCCKS